MQKKTDKEVFKEHLTCPHCKKRIIAKKTKKILKAAIPAEVEFKVSAEKDNQKTLTEATKETKKAKLPEVKGAVRLKNSERHSTGLENDSIMTVRARG